MSGNVAVGATRWIARGWARCRLALVCLFLAFLPALALAHTIAEVMKTPAAFDQQPVNVAGEVANVVTRYGETLYTTFDLVDADGVVLPVFTWGKPAFKQGDLCRVTGTFVLEKTVGTHTLAHGVEAEKVEKVSAAGYQTAGQLFRKKRRPGTGPEGKYPRGFYVPQ
ncbi:MAG: hypothetical protein HYZ72_08810 [Deltaproteobacteria bacterium]|nr:hypothetical protein [Deltaproteobacteria bacterium]